MPKKNLLESNPKPAPLRRGKGDETMKKNVQLLLQGNKVVVISDTGDFLKLFKVNMGYQHDIAKFLSDNNYKISKQTASNFPYLEMFTS